MKLIPLGGADGPDCYLLVFRKTTLLLECGVQLESLKHFWPLEHRGQGENGVERREQGSKRLRIDTSAEGEGDVSPSSTGRGSPFVRRGEHVYARTSPLFRTAALHHVDLRAVDAILLSSAHSLLGLPYVTELSDFRGKVYAPEPLLAIATQWVAELHELHRTYHAHSAVVHCDALVAAAAAHLPQAQRAALGDDGAVWRRLYSHTELLGSLARVKGLHYSQEEVLIGGAVRVTPEAGGANVGSACWVIKSGGRKVVYMGSASIERHGVAAEMHRTPLRQADALILPTLAPARAAEQTKPLTCITAAVKVAVLNKGSVLIPVHPGGTSLQLLEAVGAALDQLEGTRRDRSPGGTGDRDVGRSTRLYYIAPAAEAAVAHASVSMEWLHPNRQNLVFNATAPFKHQKMVADGRLSLAGALHDMQGDVLGSTSPAVVFAPAVSLLAGPAATLLRAWKHDSRNLLVLTERDCQDARLLAPYEPTQLTVLRASLDPHLTASDAAALLQDLRPSVLLVSEADRAALLDVKRSNKERALGTDAMVSFNALQREPVSVSLPPEPAAACMTAELAQHVELADVVGVPFTAEGRCPRAARVSARLRLRDGQCTLTPVDKGFGGSSQQMMGSRCMLWGQPQVHSLQHHLEQQGFDWVTVSPQQVDAAALFATQAAAPGGVSLAVSPSGKEEVVVVRVQLGEEAGTVTLAANATRIDSDSHVVRRLLGDAILSQLHVL